MNEYTLSWGGVQGPRKEAASREDMEEEEEPTGRGQREAMGRGTGRSDSWDGCREDMPTFQGSSVFISTEKPPLPQGTTPTCQYSWAPDTSTCTNGGRFFPPGYKRLNLHL